MSALLRPAAAAESRSRPTGWRRWVAPLVSPPVFDFWARRLHPTLSWDRALARVIEVRAESRDAVTLVLRPNRHFQGYVPGQHVNVSAEVEGMRVTRSYSATDVPRSDGRLSLSVKHIPGGRLSTLLCTRTQPGDILELGPAFGELCLPQPLPDKILLLAAGSGITPLMSLARQLAAGGMPADTTLLYWARHRDEFCFQSELRAIAARTPGFRVRFMLTREAAQKPDEAQGRIDARLIARKAPDLAQRAVFACGPAAFVAEARKLAAGVARSFQAEAFTPPTSAIEAGATIRVELRKTGRLLELPSGTPLLPALEAQGLRPAYGCRMGICKTCVCGKLSGISQDLHTGDLQTEPEQALRLCVSAAASDLVLDL